MIDLELQLSAPPHNADSNGSRGSGQVEPQAAGTRGEEETEVSAVGSVEVVHRRHATHARRPSVPAGVLQ